VTVVVAGGVEVRIEDGGLMNPLPPLEVDEVSGAPSMVKSEKWEVSQVTVWATGSRVQLARTFQAPVS
jgi:hypothetical protein